jgi:hypothetical protein
MTAAERVTFWRVGKANVGADFVGEVKAREIAANLGRESSRHESFYGYKQCDVHLCKKSSCFDVFH